LLANNCNTLRSSCLGFLAVGNVVFRAKVSGATEVPLLVAETLFLVLFCDCSVIDYAFKTLFSISRLQPIDVQTTDLYVS